MRKSHGKIIFCTNILAYILQYKKSVFNRKNHKIIKEKQKKAHYHYKFIYCLILTNIQQHCVTI